VRREHLTRHIGFRVDEKTYSIIRDLADASDTPLNEWCRARLVDSLKGQAATAAELAVLSETHATKEIVVNLLYYWYQKMLSPQSMQRVIDEANKQKFQHAEQILDASYRRMLRQASHTRKSE
jgi:hypothetical protein